MEASRSPPTALRVLSTCASTCVEEFPRRYDENTCDHGLEKSGFPMSSHPSGGVRRRGSKRALW